MTAPLDPAIAEAVERGKLTSAILERVRANMRGNLRLAYDAAGAGELGFTAAITTMNNALRDFALELQKDALEAGELAKGRAA